LVDKYLFIFFLSKVKECTHNNNNIYKKKGQKKHWENIDNCRQFFCDMAASKGFDIMEPHNWKRITMRDIIVAGVCGNLSTHKITLNSIHIILGTRYKELSQGSAIGISRVNI